MFCEEKLSEKEMNEILIPRSWFKDYHMDAASTILRRQFPNIGGFMSVRLSQLANYPVPNKERWIQILHSPGHWLVVAKGFFDAGSAIRVYDRYDAIKIVTLWKILLN